MKLLFDNNLSFRLIKKLEDLFPHSSHIREISSVFASDAEIWKFAKENEFIIVTQDDDFSFMSELYGSPPKVVWIRIGNSPTRRIEFLLRENFETIVSFADQSKADCLILK